MDANYCIGCAFLLEYQEQTHYETLNYFDFLSLLGSMTLALFYVPYLESYIPASVQ